jgi:hypothetical protein
MHGENLKPLIQFAFRFFVTLRILKLMKVWTLLVETRYSKYYNWNARQPLRSFSWIGWITSQLQVTYLWTLKIILQETGLFWCTFLALSLVRWCYNIYYHMVYSKWISFNLDNCLNNFVRARFIESFQVNQHTSVRCWFFTWFCYIISVVSEIVDTVWHFWRVRWFYVIISQPIRLKEKFCCT